MTGCCLLSQTSLQRLFGQHLSWRSWYKDGSFSLFSVERGIFSARRLGVGACQWPQHCALPLGLPIDVVGEGRRAWELSGIFVLQVFFSLGGVCRLFVFWLVLLCTSNLHERVLCSQVGQAKET